MKLAFATLALALLAATGAAQAQRLSTVTGGKLGQLCESRDHNQAEACTAYLNGVSDTISAYQRVMPEDGSKGGKLPDYVCVPGATTGVQLRGAYVAWLKGHADAQAESASQASIRALRDTYKCGH